MKLCRNIQECLRNSDIVVSGIPFSKDGIIINSPYSDEKIEIEQLREELKYKRFYAGGIPTYFYEDKDTCVKNGDHQEAWDYFKANGISAYTYGCEEIKDECGNTYYGVYYGNMEGEKYYY